MNWLDRLEGRFGRLCIPGLMRIVVAGMAFVFCCDLLFPAAQLPYYLYFDPVLIARGQVWRLVSFIFLPPESSLLFIVFALYFYYLIGTSLENEWGSFRFSLYYLVGMLGTIIAGFISGGATNSFLNLSLFFAFAAVYPNMQVLLFFFIPLKIKYLALFDAFLFLIQFILGGWQVRAVILASLLNLLLFFGPTLWRQLRGGVQRRRRQDEWRRQMRR